MKTIAELNVPESWDEVSYSKAIRLFEIEDEVQLINVLCDTDKAEDIKFNEVEQILECLKFVDDMSIFTDEQPIAKYMDFDFGGQSFKTVKDIENIFKQNSSKRAFDIMPLVMKRLIGIDISNEPVKEWIGTANFFLFKSLIFLTNLKGYQKVKQVQKKSKRG